LIKLKRIGQKIDYVSICSQLFTRLHIRFALRHHADAICEKPLVLTLDVDALTDIEKETGKKSLYRFAIALHPNIIQLKKES